MSTFDEDNHKDVCAHFGLTIYYAQVLEHGIVNAMVVCKLSQGPSFTGSDVDPFMDNQFQKTLGKLIKNLRKLMPISNELESSLSTALNKRNWLIHKYFRERISDNLSYKGRQKMISELEETKEYFIRVDNMLEKELLPYMEKFGLTDEMIQVAYTKLVEGTEFER